MTSCSDSSMARLPHASSSSSPPSRRLRGVKVPRSSPSSLEVEQRIGSSKKRGRQSHRTQKQRDAFQSAILGVNDGLVSTLALLLGVAGAGSGAPAVRVGGFARLIAGACSLAVSQYIAGQTILDRRQRIAK